LYGTRHSLNSRYFFSWSTKSLLKVQVFLDIMCRLVNSWWCFREFVASCLANWMYSEDGGMEFVWNISNLYPSAGNCISEDSNCQQICCDNIKAFKLFTVMKPRGPIFNFFCNDQTAINVNVTSSVRLHVYHTWVSCFVNWNIIILIVWNLWEVQMCLYLLWHERIVLSGQIFWRVQIFLVLLCYHYWVWGTHIYNSKTAPLSPKDK
jgi:hypothetical protein